MTSPHLPELAIFDRNATRWAVFRGLLRTAGLVVVLFLVLSMLSAVVGAASSRLGDHSERL